MNYFDLIAHYQTPSEAARAIGVDRRVVHNWAKRGIPRSWQLAIELVTDGKLVRDPSPESERAA